MVEVPSSNLGSPTNISFLNQLLTRLLKMPERVVGKTVANHWQNTVVPIPSFSARLRNVQTSSSSM